MDPQNTHDSRPKDRTCASYRKLIKTIFPEYTPIWINADSIDVHWATFVNYLLPNK